MVRHWSDGTGLRTQRLDAVLFTLVWFTKMNLTLCHWTAEVNDLVKSMTTGRNLTLA